MARFATTIEIAGQVFSGCRGLIINGEEFADSIKGSIEWAADSTPHVQTINTQYKGIQFGISLGSEEGAITIAKLNDTLDAIRSAMSTSGTFPFVYVDEQYNINVNAVPDYSQKWYTSGKFSEGYVKGVTFNFVVRSSNAVSLSS